MIFQDEVLWCEECLKRDIKKKLQLYQINFEESIFLCQSRKCVYPLREENIVRFIRKRKFSELEVSTSKKLNNTDKKFSKKSRLSNAGLLSFHIKNHGNDHRNSFSSSSNDFVDDLMDVSLEALDMPAESVNMTEGESKTSFVENEIGCVPTALSEDMFWNEVFSPEVPDSNIIEEVISSISSDGSIEKKSDIEDVTTDFEKSYPPHNSHKSDSDISQQNDFDKSNNSDLLVHQNLPNKSEILSLMPCKSEIPEEANTEMPQKIHIEDIDMIALKEVTAYQEKNNLQNSLQIDSNDNLKNDTDILHNASSFEENNNDVIETAEESLILHTVAISEEQMEKKIQSEKDYVTVLSKVVTKNEKCSITTHHQSDSDKDKQNMMTLDISKHPKYVIPNCMEEVDSSKLLETHNSEMEQNSICSLNENNRVYPLWRNSDSLCWLDATLCLIVHNHTLKNYISQLNGNGDCHIKKLVRTYEQAVSLANNELSTICEKPATSWENLLTLMNNIRDDTFTFLQRTMYCKKGENDSPVFSFPLLLHENKVINKLFLMDYRWELLCMQCGKKKIHRYKKTLPTFPSVAKDFSMLNASFFRSCFHCQAPDQRRYMRFDKLPDSFTIHFVQGLPTNDIKQYDFVYNGIQYKITAVVQYLLKPIRHFVTWVRNVEGNSWLCCDDLQDPNTAMYNGDSPVLHPSEIHIVMWERQTWNDHVENEKETMTNSDILDEELVDSIHSSPDSLITISSDESDHYEGLTETYSGIKKCVSKPKEINLKPLSEEHNISIPPMEERINLDLQKIDENTDMNDQENMTTLPSEKIYNNTSGHSLKRENTTNLDCHNELNTLACVGLSEADSDTEFDFTVAEPNGNLNAVSNLTKNVKDQSVVPEALTPAVIAEPAENKELLYLSEPAENKELLYLSETELEQTIEILSSSHGESNQKETDSNTEHTIAFKSGQSNLHTYSRKNGFNICDKKTNNYSQNNTELVKSNIKIEVDDKEQNKENNTKPSGNTDDEIKELFQLEPCDPSLTTNTDVTESLCLSQKIDENTHYSVPYFIKKDTRNEVQKSHHEPVDFTFDFPDAVKDEPAKKEISVGKSSLPECMQNCKAKQNISNLEISNTLINNLGSETKISNENCSNVAVLSNLQATDRFIDNADIDDACVEICESVPLDTPIENGSISYIVEVDCPPPFITDPSSQIIVLDNNVVDIIESDELNQASIMQDTSHVNDENNKILSPNTLHIVELVAKNSDAITATTSDKKDLAKVKKTRSRKKVTETNDYNKSNPDENFPHIVRGPAALLLQRIAKIPNISLNKERTKTPEKKTKEKKVDLLKETKAALDFSDNVLCNNKLLSLDKYSSEHKTKLNRGRSRKQFQESV